MTTRATLVAIAMGFFGCSSAQAPGSDAPPPTLEITSPARGTVANGTDVMVIGSVHGAGKLQVTVNGGVADVAADGSFTAQISVEPGIAIIETHATDGSHDVRDVRAVLAGTTAPSDGSVASPLGARAGTAALTSIGNAIANAAEQINFTAAATALNPVYNNTGCLGARIDITSVSVGNIGAQLVPNTSLATHVTIDNVEVKLHAAFKVACIGGSTTITVKSTRAHVNGDLGVAVSGGKIATSIANVGVTLDGFSIDVGGVPGAIEDLLKGQARSAVENALTTTIRDRVPGLANTALASLVAKPIGTDILGHASQVHLTPSRTVLNQDGLFVAVDATVKVDGGDGGMYLATPSQLTLSVMPEGTGLGVAIADDVANQLFASLWAAGAFDRSMSIDAVAPLKILLDDDVKTLDLKLALPPTITTNGAAQLSVGDLILKGKDASGTEIQSLAISLRTTIAAAPSGNKLTLTLGTPEVHAQVLTQTDVVDAPLTDMQIEGIVGGAWGLVGQTASDALGNIPMPSFDGLTLGEPTIDGRSGFLRAAVAL